MKRRILSILTALALCLSLCPTWAFAAEVGEEDELPQGEPTGTTVEVTSESTVWTDGNTYTVTGEVTIDSRVNVSGSVKLFLSQGCQLTVKADPGYMYSTARLRSPAEPLPAPTNMAPGFPYPQAPILMTATPGQISTVLAFSG